MENVFFENRANIYFPTGRYIKSFESRDAELTEVLTINSFSYMFM